MDIKTTIQIDIDNTAWPYKSDNLKDLRLFTDYIGRVITEMREHEKAYLSDAFKMAGIPIKEDCNCISEENISPISFDYDEKNGKLRIRY